MANGVSDTENGSMFSINFNKSATRVDELASCTNGSIRSLDSGNVTMNIRKYDRIEADAAVPHHVSDVEDDEGNVVR